MSGGCRQQPDLSLATLDEYDLQPGIRAIAREWSNCAGNGFLAIDYYPVPEAFQGGPANLSLNQHLVFLINPVSRMRYAIGPIPVIRQEQQSPGVLVKAADRIHPL
jgi:hypothetical protein